MRKSILIISLLTLSLLQPVVNAISQEDVKIDIFIKENFKKGEVINFSYIIISKKSGKISGRVGILCPNAPIPFLKMIRIQLEPFKEYRDSYTGFLVDEDIEPQTCKAFVEILDPFYFTSMKEFKILTKPSFEFYVSTYKDYRYLQESKIFTKGEIIYLSYTSEVENPTISAILTYPNGTRINVTLPTFIKADQIGTYTLKVVVEKEGYKPVKKTIQFAVIKKEPKESEIKKEFICNENGVCEPEKGENYLNCPKDCPPGSKDNYCDKIKDGICDPDCVENEDPDCKVNYFLMILMGIIGGILLTLSVMYVIRKFVR